MAVISQDRFHCTCTSVTYHIHCTTGMRVPGPSTVVPLLVATLIKATQSNLATSPTTATVNAVSSASHQRPPL